MCLLAYQHQQHAVTIDLLLHGMDWYDVLGSS
jgi:hypothetical protein